MPDPCIAMPMPVSYTHLNLPYATLATLLTRDTDQRAVVNLFRTGMSALGNMDRGFHCLLYTSRCV